MTIVLRPRASLFHAEGGWFSANWHFSFDQYSDEQNMGIGDLRVFNDDRLVPGVLNTNPDRTLLARRLLDRAARPADGLLGLALERLRGALGLGLRAPGLVARRPFRLAGDLVRLALHPLSPITHDASFRFLSLERDAAARRYGGEA